MKQSTLRPVKVIAKLMALLERLSLSPAGLPLGQLARETSLPKPTAFRLLKSLKDLDYVRQDPAGGGYAIAAKFFRLMNGNAEESRVIGLCRDSMEKLRSEFRETVNLAVAEGKNVRFLLVLESPQALRTSVPVGHLSLLHATALGKSILAFSEPAMTEQYLAAAEWKRLTKKTITSLPAFRAELETVRAKGYAVDNQEYSDECVCAAAPLLFAGNAPRYAISVSMPSSRAQKTDLRRLYEALVEECRKIARKEKTS